MFIEFNYNETLLVDTDFRETVDPNKGRWNNVIDVYEKRGLDVAVNLLKALCWYCEINYGKLDYLPALIDRIKATPKSHYSYDNERFLKYEEEIRKYLVLL